MITIKDNQYPDNDILVKRLYNNHHELFLTPQSILFLVKDFLLNLYFDCSKNFQTNICSAFNLNLGDYSRFSFFIPTFVLISILVLINILLNKFEKKKYLYRVNFSFITSLAFPTTLLGYTALGSEAVYNVIMLCLVANLNLKKLSSPRLIFILLLLIYAFFLDRGNFFVLLSFFVGLWCLICLSKFFNILTIIGSLIILCLLTHVYGKEVFNLLGTEINSEKMTGLIFEINQLNLNEISLLQVFLRYFYFWLTLTNIYFANHIFSFASIILIITTFIFISKDCFFKKNKSKKIRKFFSDQSNKIITIWLLFFPFILITILPTHAYYKYYVFFLIFLMRPIQILYGYSNTFYLFLCITFIYLIERQILLLF